MVVPAPDAPTRTPLVCPNCGKPLLHSWTREPREVWLWCGWGDCDMLAMNDGVHAQTMQAALDKLTEVYEQQPERNKTECN